MTLRTIAGQQTAVSSFADPGRFTDLALFYSTLAQSDAVRSLMYRTYHVRGSMSTSPVSLGTGSHTTPLPLFSVDGTATTASEAQKTAAAATLAFIKYLGTQQDAAGVPDKDRVVEHTGGKLAVGTSPDNELVLTDPTVIYPRRSNLA